MFRPRVIPLLLLQGNGLVKSVQFKKHKYIGDPINAIKLFNDLEADELIFLDINASKKGHTISRDFVEKVGKEANMPFAVGGGIGSIDQIKSLLQAGAEKVILNTSAFRNLPLIKRASLEFGSSTIVVAMDVKNDLFNHQSIYAVSGTQKIKGDVSEWANRIEEAGAGELMVTSIKHEGEMKGMNLELIRKISESVSIPVIAHGGAGKLQDCIEACHTAFASAVAAGSLFVYQGPRRGVLINYPPRQELNEAFIK